MRIRYTLLLWFWIVGGWFMGMVVGMIINFNLGPFPDETASSVIFGSGIVGAGAMFAVRLAQSMQADCNSSFPTTPLDQGDDPARQAKPSLGGQSMLG